METTNARKDNLNKRQHGLIFETEASTMGIEL